jgi:hypothetical protein
MHSFVLFLTTGGGAINAATAGPVRAGRVSTVLSLSGLGAAALGADAMYASSMRVAFLFGAGGSGIFYASDQAG